MHKKGFSTLFIVIILGSTVLALMLTFSFSAFLSLKSSVDFENSAKARSMINVCAEIALERIKIDNNYVGEEIIVINSYECFYQVINIGFDNRLINVSARVDNIFRKLRIETNSFNPLNIFLWQEAI